MTTARGVTAEQAARAIVAAGMLLGVDPARAFEPTTRKGKKRDDAPCGATVRILAAHGVRARLGVAPVTLGKIFQVHPNALAPSQRERYGATTDRLLAISEAIGAVEDDDAKARFLEPMSGVPTRAMPSRKPEAGSRKPEAGSREVRGVKSGVNSLATERPRAVQFASWFLEAEWPLRTVARLFDVSPRELLDALDPTGATA